MLARARRTSVVGVVALVVSVLAGGVVGAAPAPARSSCPTPERGVLSTAPSRTAARTVALTFDDGPSRFTPQILAVLKAKNVRATFFVTGRAARRDPAMLRRIVAAGHRLGNHSDTHPQDARGSVPRGAFDRLSSRVRAAQMDATTRAIVAATGRRPCLFRAPGGSHWSTTTGSLARARGMSVVNWTVDTRDWTQPGHSTRASRDAIVRAATATRSRHAIVLFHDGKESPEPESRVSSNRSNTVAALGRVIDTYRARGYVFVDPTGRALPAP
ncbi:polysaccharide deacetylase family protein [Phycicoccus sp. MAQZ13P-2]|uniref:polysaccharide deacetylase family protein n=1 Tax=Phycicoccus mangrovi TaxID=2840470 RepID=UPI001C003416|nr:polysaccharide deacetylase family protein [Phycicoccus mangrovi]MBT9254752.1 polysaccharide deacetylase family protein [Phycicoccus mangrovi]MBT9273043.1 polysaccharide deacetylase family protein [Phycicoccus mangrovi]